MTDASWADDSRSYVPGLTRRRALSLVGVAGATAFTGCNALSGSKTVELEGSAVADVASGELPSIAEPLPVDGLDAHADASRTRAQDLLDAVPLPLSSSNVPNAEMREQLAEAATEAREQLTRADGAPGPRERLDALRDARESARVVNAAWAHAQNGLALSDVRKAAGRVRRDARQFRDEWEYVGSDPVRAVLVHDVVDNLVASARNHATEERRDSSPRIVTAVTVGERAGAVEHARASLADARHVGEQFTASLADPRSMSSTFTSTRDSLASTIESRVSALPDEGADLSELVDASVEGTLAGEALRSLHGELPFDGVAETAETLPERVLEQFEALTIIGGFEALRARITDGTRYRIESVDDVATRRSAAVTAIRTALDDSADKRLARARLSELPGWITYADRDLRDYGDDGTVSASALRSDVAYYLEAAVTAKATPDACRTVLDALGVG